MARKPSVSETAKKLTLSRRSRYEPTKLELGKCKLRGCGKRVEISMQRGVPESEYLNEKFCSADCAKKFFGAPLVTPAAKKAGRQKGMTG